jgi:hypothetical protein
VLFGPSALGCGTEPYAAGVRKPDSPGSVWQALPIPGYPRLASAIPGLNSGYPPLSEGRAACRSPACADPCGGPLARVVPTATNTPELCLPAFLNARK